MYTAGALILQCDVTFSYCSQLSIPTPGNTPHILFPFPGPCCDRTTPGSRWCHLETMETTVGSVKPLDSRARSKDFLLRRYICLDYASRVGDIGDVRERCQIKNYPCWPNDA